MTQPNASKEARPVANIECPGREVCEDGSGAASDTRWPCPFQGQHIIGRSPVLTTALSTVYQVADSTATVLLCGETGTGKELLARALHERSQRADSPFVAVNCAAIPDSLLESELFGHEKGSFTGAARQRVGKIERASGGTLFLDEVGDMSLQLQAKILRTLEEREVERVGGNEPIPVDVRFVAATNRDLRLDIERGRFREDLFYRLAVVVITLPPLRARGDDLRLLAEHFIALYACEYRRSRPVISAEATDLILQHPWPGNIRELRNAMERATLLASDGVVLPEHLPLALSDPSIRPPQESEVEVCFQSLNQVVEMHIRRVLAATGGHITQAAEILGVHRNTLRRKLQEYRLT